MPDVTMIDDVGDVRVIDESEVVQATKAGWRVESGDEKRARLEAEEYGTVGEQMKGVAERAASGATLGLSDAALAGIGGDEYRDAAAARKRQLGVAGDVAEVAGALAPLIATGGSSAVARGAVGATRAIGAPVRAAAAVGRGAEAATGAALKAAGMTGKTVVGRGVMTGTKLAAGGAAEGALHGAGQALSEAALAKGGNYDHLGEKLWSGAKTGAMFGARAGGGLGLAGGVAAGTAKKVAGAGLLKKMLVSQKEGAVSRALGAKTGHLRKLSQKQGLDNLADDLLQHKMADGSALFRAGDSRAKLAARIKQARDEAGDQIGTMRRAAADADVDSSLAADAIRKRVLEPLESSPIPAVAKKAKYVEKQLKKLFDGDVRTIGELEDIKRGVDELVWPGDGGLQIAPKGKRQLEEARAEIRKVLNDATEDALVTQGHELAGKYAAINKKYGTLTDAIKITEDEAAHAASRNRVSPFETLSSMAGMAGAAMGNPALAVAGIGYGMARNAFRNKGEIALAVLADRAARSELKLNSGIKRFFEKGAQARRGLIGEGAGEEVEAKSRIQRTLRPKKTESMGDAYRRRLKEVADADPRRIRDIDDAMGAAPKATTAAVASMVRAKQHLLDTAPTTVNGDDVLQPHIVKPEPNREQLEKWSRRLEIIDDPIGTVTRALKDNTLMREHVHTLREVYPQTYQDLRRRMWTQLTETKTRLPYPQRIRLGVLFELPTDKSLQPQNIARSQSIYTPTDQMENAPQVPPANAQTQIANKFATASQNIEGGNMEV